MGPKETGAFEGTLGTCVGGRGSSVRLVLRTLTRTLTRTLPRTLAVAAAVAFLVSGCSSDMGFPAIHDMPAPRAEAPLTPDQVKQATDALISERDHLSTEAQSNGQPGTAANAAGNAAAGAPHPSSAAQPTVTGSTQTSAYAKP